MAKWFDVPYALMQLSVALYLALSAALQIVIGPLSDRYGRRTVLLVVAERCSCWRRWARCWRPMPRFS